MQFSEEQRLHLRAEKLLIASILKKQSKNLSCKEYCKKFSLMTLFRMQDGPLASCCLGQVEEMLV